MIDSISQIAAYANQLKNCFYKDRMLALRILVFIFTGMCVIWLFLGLALFLFLITLMQVPAEGLNAFIKDENISPAVRITRILVAYPVAALVYIVSPFLQIILWLMQFFYNCFAYITSLGESGWVTLKLK